MLKAICKNLVWMALPLSLALGCAANRSQADLTVSPSGQVVSASPEAVAPSYGPVETLTPTSGEPERRIYSTVDPGKVGSRPSVVTPGGANPTTWKIAEEIRQKMMADPSFARVGNSLIAEIGNDGTVTIKGTVGSPSEKDHIRECLLRVSGVKGINDEALRIGKYSGNGTVDMMK